MRDDRSKQNEKGECEHPDRKAKQRGKGRKKKGERIRL